MSEVITLKELFKSGGIEKGSWISRKATEDRIYTINTDVSGNDKSQEISIKKDQEILGRFIREKNGILEVAGRVTEFEVAFKGIVGFRNVTFELFNICNDLYSSLEHGIVTYPMNEDQYGILSKTKRVSEENPLKKEPIEQTDKEYWLATQKISRMGIGLGMKYIRGGVKEECYFSNFSEKLESNIVPYVKHICPWHFLAANNLNLKVLVDYDHNGLSPDTPYEIVLD